MDKKAFKEFIKPDMTKIIITLSICLIIALYLKNELKYNMLSMYTAMYLYPIRYDIIGIVLSFIPAYLISSLILRYKEKQQISWKALLKNNSAKIVPRVLIFGFIYPALTGATYHICRGLLLDPIDTGTNTYITIIAAVTYSLMYITLAIITGYITIRTTSALEKISPIFKTLLRMNLLKTANFLSLICPVFLLLLSTRIISEPELAIIIITAYLLSHLTNPILNIRQSNTLNIISRILYTIVIFISNMYFAGLMAFASSSGFSIQLLIWPIAVTTYLIYALIKQKKQL